MAGTRFVVDEAGQPQVTPAQVSDLTLLNVVEKFDLVDVGHSDDGTPFIVVSEKGNSGTPIQLKESADINEIGTSSPSPFTSEIRREYNRDLQGLKGLQKFDRMRKSSGVVRGTLRTVKTPVLSGRWFMKPYDTKKRNQNAAEFVGRCLFEYMSISFPQVLTEALLMCDFGYYMFEKVWENRIIDGQMRTVLKKLAPRHPMDVKEWKYDANGGPAGVVMYTTDETGYRYHEVYIPIEKLLVFTFDREAGNIEGISVLRSAYKHWFFVETLEKIDAIQKERHGIGIPVIKLPPGFSPADKIAAQDLGANLRTNERAHVVLPPMWDLLFAKLEGNPVNALESMEYHDARIRENVLASFQGNESPTKEEDQTMFLKATRFIADIVCEVFNLHLIPQLMSYNFERVDAPRLMVRRIGEQQDWRTWSFALRNLIGAGVIRPDDKLEAYAREEMDLPEADPETARDPKTGQNLKEKAAQEAAAAEAAAAAQEQVDPNQPPANGGKQNMGQNQVGLPRQSPLPPVGTGSTRSGTDRSGG